MALDVTQKEELAALLAQEHVGVLVTPGDRWPTPNLQAFAETPELENPFHHGGNAEKFQNLTKQPGATVPGGQPQTSAQGRDLLRYRARVMISSATREARQLRSGRPEWERFKGDFPEEESSSRSRCSRWTGSG